VGTAKLKYLSEKKNLPSQKQFYLKTTFIEFADNVSHDSFFSWKKSKQNKKKKVKRILLARQS